MADTPHLASRNPDPRRAQTLRDIVIESIVIPIVVSALLMLGAAWRLTHLPAGKAFVLEPRGMGLVYEIAVGLGVVVAFGFLYTLPAMCVRRSLGCVLRLLMFVVLFVSLAIVQCEKCIAVVQTPTAYVFVWPMPFGTRTVPFSEMPVVRLRSTSVVTGVEIGDGHAIVLRPVFHVDTQTQRVLASLLDAFTATGAVVSGRMDRMPSSTAPSAFNPSRTDSNQVQP